MTSQPSASADPTQAFGRVESYLSDALKSMKENGGPYTLSLSPQLLAEIQSSTPNDVKSQVVYSAPAVDQSGRSFTRGFIIGQLSVIVIIALFIRFFIFSEATPQNADKKHVRPKITGFGSANGSQGNKEGVNDSALLGGIQEKTYYDVANHPPESMDWFNVLVAQMIMQIRRKALVNDNIYHSLDKAFNNSSLADYTDKITITEVNIGDDFPILSNCRIVNEDGRLEAKIDVDVSDTLTLAAETSFLINSPKPMTASLPVQIKVSMVRFSGCLTVAVVSLSPSTKDAATLAGMSQEQKQRDLRSRVHEITEISSGDSPAQQRRTALMFSFGPDFRLEFEIKSLIGSKAKLEDMPRITSIIENALRKWIIDRFIEPRFQVIRLPSIWTAPEKADVASPGVKPETESK